MDGLLGTDLSEMNGRVDFAALKAAGVRFVILRCGYGGDWPGQQDARFEEHLAGALQAGLPWGCYHYSYAKSADGGRAEAAHALRLLKGRKPPLGLWLDMEDASALGGDLAGAAEGFLSAVEAQGLRCGVYANLNWWRNYLCAPVFDRYPRWCAQYHSRCDLQKPWVLWQYTDSLNIGGKRFDGNLAPAAFWEEKEEDMTRQEVLELLDEREKERAAKPVSGWAQAAVENCRALGLMAGDEGGAFRPQAALTRQEAALLASNLVRLLRGGGEA